MRLMTKSREVAVNTLFQVFENKAYLYNILTNIIPVSFGDVMSGFARVISE